MSKYKRRHTGYNLSPAVFWILFAAVVAYAIYRVVQFRREVNEVHKSEMQELNDKEPLHYYPLPSDSTARR